MTIGSRQRVRTSDSLDSSINLVPVVGGFEISGLRTAVLLDSPSRYVVCVYRCIIKRWRVGFSHGWL
jgi:hypothetical protein